MFVRRLGACREHDDKGGESRRLDANPCVARTAKRSLHGRTRRRAHREQDTEPRRNVQYARSPSPTNGSGKPAHVNPRAAVPVRRCLGAARAEELVENATRDPPGISSRSPRCLAGEVAHLANQVRNERDRDQRDGYSRDPNREPQDRPRRKGGDDEERQRVARATRCA